MYTIAFSEFFIPKIAHYTFEFKHRCFYLQRKIIRLQNRLYDNAHTQVFPSIVFYISINIHDFRFEIQTIRQFWFSQIISPRKTQKYIC